jgi:hypothetical protein
VPLALLVSPANAGSASLLDRYLATSITARPVVPNRGEVDRVERDLLARRPVLLGGSIGTFDDLFERLAPPGRPPVLSRLERALVLVRAIERTRLSSLSASSRFPGFVDALGDTIADLGSALVDPGEVGGELGTLFAAYRDELDRLVPGIRRLRRRAVTRLESEAGAWGTARAVYPSRTRRRAGALLNALVGRWT